MWRLSRIWAGGRRWYQLFEFSDSLSNISYCASGPERLRYRMEQYVDALSSLDLDQEDTLLDIGSNAGLYSFLCAPRVKKVIAVEYDKIFHRQAMLAKELWQKYKSPLPNVDLVNDSVTNCLDMIRESDVILASKVLYHSNLGDGVHDVIRAIGEGKARKVLIQGHDKWGEMGTSEGAGALFEEYGFTITSISDDPEYPISLATK